MNLTVHLRRQCTMCGYVAWEVNVMIDHVRHELYPVEWDERERFVLNELCLQQLSPLFRSRFLVDHPDLFYQSSVTKVKVNDIP